MWGRTYSSRTSMRSSCSVIKRVFMGSRRYVVPPTIASRLLPALALNEYCGISAVSALVVTLLFAWPIVNSFVPLHFDDRIVIVDKHNDGIEVLELGRFDPCLCEYDDLITWLEMPCGWAIQAYIAISFFAGHDIRLPEDAVRDVRYVDVLERPNAALLQQRFIDGDRADVIQIGLRNGGSMYFCHARAYEHTCELLYYSGAVAQTQRFR